MTNFFSQSTLSRLVNAGVTVGVLSLVFLGAVGLQGCTPQREIEEKYETLSNEADDALREISPSNKMRSSLIVEDRPWFGHQAVRMRNGDPLPPRLNEKNSIVLTFERALTLEELARQLQVSTGLRVVVPNNTAGMVAGVATTTEEKRFLPIDGVEVAGGRVLWQGGLQDLLNQVADQFDVEWTYVNDIIRLSDRITRTFMLHALAGDITTSGKVESGSTQEAGNLPTQEVDTQVTLQIWGDIKAAIDSIVGTSGVATYSSSTGTITVSGKPSTVRDVEEYLRNQNKMRLRRVAVTVRVLSIQTTETNNLNFDLEGVLERGFDGSRPISFSNTATSGLSAAILRNFPTDQQVGGANADAIQGVISALASVGKVSIVHTGTVVTMSDQPAPLQVARQISYIARVSSATTGDSSSASLEPGTVEEGLTMNVLPRVIEKDRVLLRVGIGVTQVRDIQSVTSGDLTIQLPDLDTTGFLQNMVLSGGETLIMSGFERDSAAVDDQGTGFASNMFLGGVRERERSRNVTVLLITTDILPEDPFGVTRR